MEGLTDSIYRQLHHTYFPGIHRYYTPFLSPTVHRSLTLRETREIPPADSLNYTSVPQLLTKSPEDFLWMAHQCLDLGYTEVNLNLGCPSGTVTAKGKGSAMLAEPDALDSFLEAIFSKAQIPISVKTRIGFHSSQEFPALMEIFNRYPLQELIVHPRVRDAFYKGSVDLEAFNYAQSISRCPVCYNGNLYTAEQVHAFAESNPHLSGLMLGRGLIGDPGMLTPSGTTVAALEPFYNALLEEYLVAFGGSRNAMFRLKEHWFYLIQRFEPCEKLSKKLRKATDVSEYKAITTEIFHTIPLRASLPMNW